MVCVSEKAELVGWEAVIGTFKKKHLDNTEKVHRDLIQISQNARYKGHKVYLKY